MMDKFRKHMVYELSQGDLYPLHAAEGRFKVLMINLSLFLKWKIGQHLVSLQLQVPKITYAAKPHPRIMLMV